MTSLTCRLATVDDLEYLGFECVSLFNESNFLGAATFSAHNTLTSLAGHIESDQSFILIAAENGVDCGFCIWSFDRAWTVEPVAIEMLFYVNPEHRRGKAGRELLQESMRLCDNAGVVLMYSTSTAGFDDGGVNARAYNILFKSCGFTEMSNSRVLMRSNNG